MRKQLYEYVRSADARAAFDYLERALTGGSVQLTYKLKGNVHSVDFHNGRGHIFSFIPNRADLLFYIRQPALQARPSLAAKAINHHPGRVNVDRLGRPVADNSQKETRIRIANLREAEALAGWLVAEYPI